ncbi:hypothetical protein [Actinoallomurus sp. CA-142502]|uniref:hypothetical protein n=1 Tax=Actinoallomurus sp. CA-142502 TaxID=3239885 RepID=UPI003D8A217D
MTYPAVPSPTPTPTPTSGYPANGGQWTAQQAQDYAWQHIPWIKSRVQPLYDAAQAFRDFAATVQTVIDQGTDDVKNDLKSWVGDGRDSFVREWARDFSGDRANWYSGLSYGAKKLTRLDDQEQPPAEMLLILKDGSLDAADQMEGLANAVGSLLFTDLVLQVIDVVLTVVTVLVPIAGLFGKIGEMIFMKGVEEVSVQAAKEVAVQFVKTSITAALKNLAEMTAKNLALQLLKGAIVGAGIDIGFQIFNQNAFNQIYSSMMGEEPPPLQANINVVEVIESAAVGAASEGFTHWATPKINALTKDSEFWQSGAGQRAINASLAIGTGLGTDAALQGFHIAMGWQKGWNWEQSAQNVAIGVFSGFHPPHTPPPDGFTVRQDHPGGYTKTWQFTEHNGTLSVLNPRTGREVGTGHWNDGAIDVTYKDGGFEKVTLAGTHVDHLTNGTQTVRLVDPKTGKLTDVQMPTKTLTSYGVDGAGQQHFERQATYYANGTAEIRDEHGIYQTQHRLDHSITVDPETGKIIQYDGKSGSLDPSVLRLPEGSVVTVNDQGIVTSVMRPGGDRAVDLYALGPDGHLDRVGTLRQNGDGLLTMTDDPGHRTTVETKDATYSAADTPVDRTGRGAPTLEYRLPTRRETGTMWEQRENPLFTLHKGQVTPVVPTTREQAHATPVSELQPTEHTAPSLPDAPEQRQHGASDETPGVTPDLATAQSLNSVLGSVHPDWMRGAVDAFTSVAPGGRETFRMPVPGTKDPITVTVTRDPATRATTLTLDPDGPAAALDRTRLAPGIEDSLRKIADATGTGFRVEVPGGEAGSRAFGFHPSEGAHAFHQVLESISVARGEPVRTTVDLGEGTRVSFTPRVVREPGRRETIRLTDLEVEGDAMPEHEAVNQMRSLVTDLADALGRRVEVIHGDGPGVRGENILLAHIPDLPVHTAPVVAPTGAELFPPVESGRPPVLPAPVRQPSSVPEFGRGEVAEYVAAVYQTGGEIQRFSFPIEHEGTTAFVDVTGDVDIRTGEVTLRLAPGENAEALRGRIPREVVVAQAEETLRGIAERLPGSLTVHNGELDVVLNPPEVAHAPGEGAAYGVRVEDMRAIHGAALLPGGDKRVTVHVPPDVTPENAAYEISWTTRYVLGVDGEARLVLHEPMVDRTLPDGTRTYGPLESLSETERSEVFGPIQRLLEQVSGRPVDVVGAESARVQPETMKVGEVGVTSGKPEQVVPKIAASPEQTAAKVPLPKPRVLTQAEPGGNNVPDYPQAEVFSKNNGLKPLSPNATRPLNPYGPVEPLPKGQDFGPNNLPPGDVYPELPWAAPGKLVVVPGVDPSAVLHPDSPAFERLWKALWHLNLDTHLEHNVVEFEDGSFHIVEAGKYALLDDGSLAIKRIWMHVHPHWLPATGPSMGDLRFLGMSPGQKSAILIEQGLHPYEYEVPDAVRAVLGLPPAGTSIDVGPRIAALRDLLTAPDEDLVVRLDGLVDALARDSSRLPPDAARASLIGDVKDIAADLAETPTPQLREALGERLQLLEQHLRGGTASPLADDLSHRESAGLEADEVKLLPSPRFRDKVADVAGLDKVLKLLGKEGGAGFSDITLHEIFGPDNPAGIKRIVDAVLRNPFVTVPKPPREPVAPKEPAPPGVPEDQAPKQWEKYRQALEIHEKYKLPRYAKEMAEYPAKLRAYEDLRAANTRLVRKASAFALRYARRTALPLDQTKFGNLYEYYGALFTEFTLHPDWFGHVDDNGRPLAPLQRNDSAALVAYGRKFDDIIGERFRLEFAQASVKPNNFVSEAFLQELAAVDFDDPMVRQRFAQEIHAKLIGIADDINFGNPAAAAYHPHKHAPGLVPTPNERNFPAGGYMRSVAEAMRAGHVATIERMRNGSVMVEVHATLPHADGEGKGTVTTKSIVFVEARSGRIVLATHQAERDTKAIVGTEPDAIATQVAKRVDVEVPEARPLPEQHRPASTEPAPETHLPAQAENVEASIATRRQHLETVTARLAELAKSPLTRIHESMELVRRLTRTYQGHLDAAGARLAEFRATALRMPVHGPIGRDDVLRFRQESLDRLSRTALGDIEEVARLERLVDRARRVVTLSSEMTSAVDDLFKDFADPAALPEAQRRMAEDVRQSVIDAVKVHEYLSRHGLAGLAEGGSGALRTDLLSRLPEVERTVHELRSELHRLDTASPAGDAAQARHQEVVARLEAALSERDRLDRAGRRYLQAHPELLPVEEAVSRTRVGGLEAALAEATSRGDGTAAGAILDDLGRARDQLRWIESRRAMTDLRSHIDEVRAQADAARHAGDTARVTELESRLAELERALGSLRSVPGATRSVEYALGRLAGIDAGPAASEQERGRALHRLVTKLWKLHDEGHVALDPDALRKAAAGDDDALAGLLDQVRRAGEPETILSQAGVHGPVEHSPEPTRPLPVDPRSRTVRAALADSRKASPKLWRLGHLERQAAKLETTDPVKAARLRAKKADLTVQIKKLLDPVEPLAEKVIADEMAARPDVAFVQAAIDEAPALHSLWNGDVIDVASRHVGEAYRPVANERVNLDWQRRQDETYIQTRGEAQRLDAADGRELFRHMAQVMGGGRKGLLGGHVAATLGDPRSWQGVTTTDLDVPVTRKVHLTHREIIKDWLTGRQPWPDPIGGILPVDSKILHSRHTVATPNGVELTVEVYRHQSLIIDSGRVTEGGLSMLRIDGGLGDGILPFWHMLKPVDVPIELGPITLKVSVPVGPNLDLQYIPGLRRDFHLYDQVGRETIVTRYGPGPRDFWVYETPASELRPAGDVFQTEQFYTKWGVQLATFPTVQVAATVPGIPPSERPALFQFGGVGLVQVTGEFSLFFDPHTGHFLQPDWTVGAEALTGLFASVPDVIGGVRIHPDLHGFLGWGPSPGTVPWNRVRTFDLKPWIEHYGRRLLLKTPGVKNVIHERLAATERAALATAEAKAAEETRIGRLLESLKNPSPVPPPAGETPPKVADVLRGEMRALVTDAGKRVRAAVEAGAIGPEEQARIETLVGRVQRLADGSGAIPREVLQRHAPAIRELRKWLGRLPVPDVPAKPVPGAHAPGGAAGEARPQAAFRVPPRPRPSLPGDTDGRPRVRPDALPRRVVLQPEPSGSWSRPLRERPPQGLPSRHDARPQNPPGPRKLRLMPITRTADEPHLSPDEPEPGTK